jgi:hypothetical protein
LTGFFFDFVFVNYGGTVKEGRMKRQLVLAVVLALSGSLFLMAGEQAAQADPPIKDLSEVTQNWDKNLPSKSRFTILQDFNNQAVRDNNTGLVWEKDPKTTGDSWHNQKLQCTSRTTCGQMAWRMPSVHELASLIDPSVAPLGLKLSPGHPFNVAGSTLNYWSATVNADDPSTVYGVNFNVGSVDFGPKGGPVPVWCVRGPTQESVY